MEPSLPSSYKKTLALAYLRVILNEYWSIGRPWARSSTMQRIRSCASFIKVGVANAQMGVAPKFSRALCALSLIEPSFGYPRSATVEYTFLSKTLIVQIRTRKNVEEFKQYTGHLSLGYLQELGKVLIIMLIKFRFHVCEEDLINLPVLSASGCICDPL